MLKFLSETSRKEKWRKYIRKCKKKCSKLIGESPVYNVNQCQGHMTKVRPSLFVRMWAYFCTNIKLHACTRVRTEALQYCHPGAIRPIMGLFAVSTHVRIVVDTLHRKTNCTGSFNRLLQQMDVSFCSAAVSCSSNVIFP
jgi:hypothetical protein